jgi:hypothetical protein
MDHLSFALPPMVQKLFLIKKLESIITPGMVLYRKANMFS